MKKVALISSFCDSQEKLDVLLKNMKIISDYGLDIILISPFSLPDEIVNKTTYFFKTNDNPVLHWPIKSMYFWREIFLNGELFIMSTTTNDYGWAGLTQVKQLSEIGLLFNYDQFFHLIYDIKIDENVINCFKSNKICNVYPSKRWEQVWKVGLHLMVFNRENLKRFISHIHLDSYLKITAQSDCFVWLETLQNFLPFVIESTPIEDEIYFYDNLDIYDSSPSKDFSMFIVKDDELKGSIKLLFYNVKNPQNFKIKINSNDLEYFMNDYFLIDLNTTDNELKEVQLSIDNFTYNILDKIKKVGHNTLRKC